jgi:hypothetical protein
MLSNAAEIIAKTSITGWDERFKGGLLHKHPVFMVELSCHSDVLVPMFCSSTLSLAVWDY